MATVTAEMVKQLRDRSGAGIMDCKEALTECDGDLDKAADYLRKKGLATAKKRAGRVAAEGVIQSYIHMGGKIGVLVEVNCETDFVAKTDEFKEFARNIAMHIAASSPLGVVPEDIPEAAVEILIALHREIAVRHDRVVYLYVPRLTYRTDQPALEWPEAREVFLEFARRTGATLVDPTDRLQAAFEATGQPLHGFHNSVMGEGHLNEAGHLVVGEALAEGLADVLGRTVARAGDDGA